MHYATRWRPEHLVGEMYAKGVAKDNVAVGWSARKKDSSGKDISFYSWVIVVLPGQNFLAFQKNKIINTSLHRAMTARWELIESNDSSNTGLVSLWKLLYLYRFIGNRTPRTIVYDFVIRCIKKINVTQFIIIASSGL